MCPTEQCTTGETPRARTRAKVVISCSTFSNADHGYINVLYNTLFSREENFAKSEFEIFSREDIFANLLFTRTYLTAKISSRENIFPRKYLLAKISSRENIFPRKYANFTDYSLWFTLHRPMSRIETPGTLLFFTKNNKM